jgi:hypothetical protein
LKKLRLQIRTRFVLIQLVLTVELRRTNVELSYIRAEIERMLRQIPRQRKEIQALERAGIPTKSAGGLLERMLAKVDGLRAERDRQVHEERKKYPGTNKVINGPIEQRFR